MVTLGTDTIARTNASVGFVGSRGETLT